jgi:hypothetical protein
LTIVFQLYPVFHCTHASSSFLQALSSGDQK